MYPASMHMLNRNSFDRKIAQVSALEYIVSTRIEVIGERKATLE